MYQSHVRTATSKTEMFCDVCLRHIKGHYLKYEPGVGDEHGNFRHRDICRDCASGIAQGTTKLLLSQ